ncbi:MAG: hypothetical protein A3B07_01605 [Candidatus Yonathbacteria bacterium RIFCSPLOWO2_01_FULL_43_27]|uniref:Metal-dependent hydrolase n=2 Tax=Parcubacteria group TaxID=1794811 RepID=A0A1G2SC71_9BACT|nr:MAG: Metal-dependent protein hydrolase [Candidatus Azambacteria bacterium GW2011_GWA1_44_9]OHA78973.1 MAG: hypothetical protein A2658_01400 [Candidatus Yonathbacteria bacterium RIFCSPHIGHO2_01_FULL_44_19]OHA82610.1 MAG: hypothetical protein A3B07_01605 [Candidatus Yonathbacteria bacterium RIFCSPLOWO2_01_FULL_43_27]
MNAVSIKKIVTHSGNFHADEIFACATLSLLFDGAIEIVRSRDPKVWETGDVVLDVGSVYDEAQLRFDHHQEGFSEARENGIPYASFGLIWKHFGEKVAGSAYAARVIDERLVQPIDAGDNGVETYTRHGDVSPYLISDVIGSFRPAWNEKRTGDLGFHEAFLVALQILKREIVLAQGEEEGTRRTEEAYAHAEDKRIIIIDSHYSWYGVLKNYPEPLFVVKPNRETDGQWKVEAVRDDTHSFKNRKNLPLAWAGKKDGELAQISGVSDATFCHNKRFIAVASSKEGALLLARRAVEHNE